MSAKLLKVLVCGGDILTLQRIARTLINDGVTVKTSTRMLDQLYFAGERWDFLLIDLDGLTSFLCNLLPVIRRRFPYLYMVGISTQPNGTLDYTKYGLKLDGYLVNQPRLEDLIVRFPKVAAKYLCDTGGLAVETTPNDILYLDSRRLV